ncbi:DUF4113 domain-containing protein [Rhodovulum marinum]|nr:DUF4113 domain-containing protein [Rhodovulum marinum]
MQALDAVNARFSKKTMVLGSEGTGRGDAGGLSQSAIHHADRSRVST